MRGPGQLLHAALLGDVDEGTHPAGLLALGIDQRGLEDQHRKARAILAHEHRLVAFARRRNGPGQAPRLPAHVFLGQLGRPVGGKALPQQLVGAETHHGAERRVDVADAALQVARAQPGDERVLHRLAEGQGVAQVALGAQAAAVVAHQHHQHRAQRNRHAGDQGRQHVREHAGRAVPAVHAQHHGVARQVQQVLGREHARAAPGRADQGQARAVGLGERDFLALREVLADLGGQDVLQRIGAHHVALDVAGLHLRQTHLHQLGAHGLAQDLEVAGRIRRAAGALGVGAGRHRVAEGFLAQVGVPHHRAVGCFRHLADVHVLAAPLHAQQFTAHLQHLGHAHAPLLGRDVQGVHRLQVLQVAPQRGADLDHRLRGVALQLVLHLRGFVAPGQPDHDDEHAGHQHDQQGPQGPAAPGAVPALPGPRLQRIYKQRCSRAGRRWRTCCKNESSRTA